MYVDSIKLINFRNYENITVKLNQKLNVFLGKNAQGKTNLLESIYISATGKSYRKARDQDLINFNKDKAYIGVEVENKRGKRFIEIKFEKGKKKIIRINKLEIERQRELSGNLNIVIFAPEDLNLIKEGPMVRRNFLDMEISQIKPRYRYNCNKYNKILYQRNNLLKKRKDVYDKELEPWDVQLSDIGVDIMLDRIAFLKRLDNISRDIHSKLSGNTEKLELKYLPSFEIRSCEREELKKIFLEELKIKRKSEKEKCITEVGPHKDDMEVKINEMSCRKFGSQGQQRTSVLSLKLAEIDLIKSETGEYPILLLDDVLSELDSGRRNYLLSIFKHVQTIITTTDYDNIDKLENKKIFNIYNGKILY